jgi:TolB protein
MILVAAAVAVVLVGTVAVVFLRSRGESESAGNGSATATSSAGSASAGTTTPSSSAPSSSLSSLSVAASAPAVVSSLGLPSSAPLTAQQLVVPGLVGDNADLYVVDGSANSVTARLTGDAAEDRSPALSPDRGTIIYVQQTDTTRTLRVMAANGGGDRALFATPPPGCARTNRPAWNPVEPDSLALVCIDAAGKYSMQLVKLGGQVVRTLDTGIPRFDDVSFSPDGTTLAFWGSDPSSFDGGSIYVMSADGGSPAQPLTNEKVGTDADPVWSPDGSEIAFRRRMPSSTQRGNLDIFAMKADGQDVRQLTTDPAMDQNPSWSPDGLEIAFSSQPDDDSAENHLWVVGKDGIRELVPAQQLSADGAPAWTRR